MIVGGTLARDVGFAAEAEAPRCTKRPLRLASGQSRQMKYKCDTNEVTMEAWCGACPFVLLVVLMRLHSFWRSTACIVVSYIAVSICAERSFASFAQARNDVKGGVRLVGLGFFIHGMNASFWVVKPSAAVDTLREILWPLLLFGIQH